MKYKVAQADCLKLPLKDDSVSLVVTSPPYDSLRTYGELGFDVTAEGWPDWAFPRFVECLRVCRGVVCWVVDGSTSGGRYSLSPERLMVRLADAGYGVRRPMVYMRHGSMNGGGPSKMPRCIHETIIVATRELRPPPWADLHDAGTEAVIKAAGGALTQRRRDGSRADAGRRVQPGRAIMKSVIDAGAVGGGNMGHPLATENEAPFSTKLVEPLVRAWCKPGNVVLDPFCGSGTTLEVALRLGRRALGFDIRESQVQLTLRRLAGL